MRKIKITLVALIISITSFADEGMWLPMFLQQMNYAEMKGLGLQLTPEQIYNINNSSVKDAIVKMGGGFCTGEIISSEGLLLTNHHCGYGSIAALSSVAMPEPRRSVSAGIGSRTSTCLSSRLSGPTTRTCRCECRWRRTRSPGPNLTRRWTHHRRRGSRPGERH